MFLSLLARAVRDLESTLPPDREEALAQAAMLLLEEHGILSRTGHLVRRLERAKGKAAHSALLLTPGGDASMARDIVHHALSSAAKREIPLTEQADPSLLGGVRIELHDDRLDTSLRGRLHLLASHLAP